jgi:integrase
MWVKLLTARSEKRVKLFLNSNQMKDRPGWLNVRTDVRRERRALSVDEVKRLLAATAAGPERFGMSGPERSLLYRLATETGLRRNELKTLAVSSFDFEACTVTVQAAFSKHRRQDTLPMRQVLPKP